MLGIVLAAVTSTRQIEDLTPHQEWTVSCDLQHACYARTLSPEPTPNALKAGDNAKRAVGVAIRRDFGANSAPRIRFAPCDLCAPDAGPDPAKIRELTVLDAAGRTIFTLQLSAREARRANTPAGLAFPADSGLFLAMAMGETLDFGDTSLKVFASVSLRGARKALGAIDTAQLRTGGVSALVERGSGKPAAVFRAWHKTTMAISASPAVAPAAVAPPKRK